MSMQPLGENISNSPNGFKGPLSLKHIAKNKLEHNLLLQIHLRNLEGVKDILWIFDLEVEAGVLPDLNKQMCNGYTPP